MEKTDHIILKLLRRGFLRVFRKSDRLALGELRTTPDEASDIIYQLLMQEKPCMIARFGAFELTTICNYLSIRNKKHSIIKFITGEESEWWWNKKLMNSMQNNAGFFPADEEHLSRYCELMLEDAKQVDVLGRWLRSEKKVLNLDNVAGVRFLHLEPYHSQRPWSRGLKGKRVLVVHPFAELMLSQYENHREQLFVNKDVLPKFHLTAIPAVQSIGGNTNGFKDWFEALQFMKDEIDRHEYDVALIGCGAYGFPLAAHVKRQGKKAVHLGGALQLLFGIKGNRWETLHYEKAELKFPGWYRTLFNEFWVYPGDKFKPTNANRVEGGCYW